MEEKYKKAKDLKITDPIYLVKNGEIVEGFIKEIQMRVDNRGDNYVLIIYSYSNNGGANTTTIYLEKSKNDDDKVFIDKRCAKTYLKHFLQNLISEASEKLKVLV